MSPSGRRLQPADATLLHAVTALVPSLRLTDADQGAVRLAEHYAQAIDAAEDKAEALEKLGPRLLAALESLGATPRARAAFLKGGGRSGPSRLDAFRASGQ
jgi:hypothetical protein